MLAVFTVLLWHIVNWMPMTGHLQIGGGHLSGMCEWMMNTSTFFLHKAYKVRLTLSQLKDEVLEGRQNWEVRDVNEKGRAAEKQ